MKQLKLLILTTTFAAIVLTMHSHGQSAMEYYDLINKGKRHLITGDYSEALIAYDQALDMPEYSLARDCFNAVEIAVLADDTVYLEKFILEALYRGIEYNDFENLELLESYEENTFFSKLESVGDSLQKEYQARINQDIRKEIIAMFEADQEVRARYYDKPFIGRGKIGDEWEELNAKQVNRIVEITKEHGFPGEHLIGLCTNEMHAKIFTNNYSAGMPMVILIHHYSQPNESFDQLFQKEVLHGNMNNVHFAVMCDFEVEFGKGKYESNGRYLFKHQPKNYDLIEIDDRRAEIGLMGVEESKELDGLGLTPFWKRLY